MGPAPRAMQLSQGEAVPSEQDVGTGENREKHVKMDRLPDLEPVLTEKPVCSLSPN